MVMNYSRDIINIQLMISLSMQADKSSEGSAVRHY
jgi:hypothetical protein